MNANELIESLKKQDVNLSNLFNSLLKQKEAIINNDFTQLENSINDEQKFLKDVEKEESIRIKIITELIKENKLTVKNYSLAEIINHLPNLTDKDIKQIQALRKSLKEKAEKVKRINSQLKDVIEFSRNLIKETMMIVAQKSKKGIVNKRV